MEKETSNQRLRKAIKRIQYGKVEEEESIEELEKKFNEMKRRVEEDAKENEKYINKRLDIVQEFSKVHNKLDMLDLKISKLLEKQL